MALKDPRKKAKQKIALTKPSYGTKIAQAKAKKQKAKTKTQRELRSIEGAGAFTNQAIRNQRKIAQSRSNLGKRVMGQLNREFRGSIKDTARGVKAAKVQARQDLRSSLSDLNSDIQAQRIARADQVAAETQRIVEKRRTRAKEKAEKQREKAVDLKQNLRKTTLKIQGNLQKMDAGTRRGWLGEVLFSKNYREGEIADLVGNKGAENRQVATAAIRRAAQRELAKQAHDASKDKQDYLRWLEEIRMAAGSDAWQREKIKRSGRQ